MKLSLRTLTLAAVVAVTVLAAAPLGAAYAHDDTTKTTTLSPDSTLQNRHSGTDETTKAGNDAVRTEAEHKTDDKGLNSTRDATEHRLTDTKLKVCERRQNTIKSIMQRGRERAQKQIDLFTAIATRTEAFYTAKGKTLSTYNDLVAAVNAAKATAETDLAAVPAPAGFDCNGTDPKGTGDSFKAAMQKEVSDLKAYRQAVKNLIAGVKSVQGDV